MPHATAKEYLDSIMLYWTLWWIGGIAMYLNKVRKGKPFKVSMFLINVFVAWWLWVIIKDFIPENMWDFEYSIVSMTWFLAFPILDWVEEKWLIYFIKKTLWVTK
jgi:hypothetical protein